MNSTVPLFFHILVAQIIPMTSPDTEMVMPRMIPISVGNLSYTNNPMTEPITKGDATICIQAKNAVMNSMIFNFSRV